MNTTVTEQADYISLYDYLGRPAGSALGYAVATYASKLKEPIRLKEIPNYNRLINTYRPTFLVDIFSNKNLKGIIEADAKEYEERKNKKAKV